MGQNTQRGHLMRRGILVIAIALAALVAAASAQAYRFTFTTPLPRQDQLQRALSAQANLQLAKHWKIDPVSFGPGGIPITVVSDVIPTCVTIAGGCHGVDGSGQPWITIGRDSPQAMSIKISHEIVETEVDPQANRSINGQLVEIADPAPGEYMLLGFYMADFVYPRYYYNLRGPWDWTRDLVGSMAAPRGGLPN